MDSKPIPIPEISTSAADIEVTPDIIGCDFLEFELQNLFAERLNLSLRTGIGEV